MRAIQKIRMSLFAAYELVKRRRKRSLIRRATSTWHGRLMTSFCTLRPPYLRLPTRTEDGGTFADAR
jgi:hypothetical protein